MKRKIFLIPIYNTRVSLFKDKKQWERATGQKIEDDDAGRVSGSYVWLSDKYFDYDTISHESYHIAVRVLHRAGIDPNADEETMAYLLGYICNILMKFYLEDK